MTKKRRGPRRPSSLTPDVESRILNAIRCGAPKKTACAAAGISEQTLYSWLRKAEEGPGSEYAAFAKKLERARQEGITARLALIERAASKDWRAAAWQLERDEPEHFSTKYKLEHSADPKSLSLAEAMVRLRTDRRPDQQEESQP